MSRSHGQLRLSQLVTTFGPGSIVDFPDYSILMGGADLWRGAETVIDEPRLIEKARVILNTGNLKLRQPPGEVSSSYTTTQFAIGFEFPNWFVVQRNEEGSTPSVKRRRLVHSRHLERRKWRNEAGVLESVVPVRFVQACERGHIDDFPWKFFCHDGPSNCGQSLYLEDRGMSGDLTDMFVVCGCGANRPMVKAGILGVLGQCNGMRPWLGPDTQERCDKKARFLIRSASHAYFGHTLKVISIPLGDPRLSEHVTFLWDNFLADVESEVDLPKVLVKPMVKARIGEWSADAIWREIEKRRSPAPATVAPKVKAVEFETLNAAVVETGVVKPHGDFDARALAAGVVAGMGFPALDKVVLVHRLREVTALLGFTRFQHELPDKDGEFQLDVKPQPVSLDGNILPAYENRGEGIFLGFNAEDVRAWRKRPEVDARVRNLIQGFDSYRAEHNGKAEFPGGEYIMLHTLAHLLITNMSLECGYSSSSIRERVYAGDGGYGILLYTGSSDAEGTLGGLVQIGPSIGGHLKSALDMARICSNDPVCAQHGLPAMDGRHLHGAACHGCVLIAETSCESFNQYLDRALVIPTLECKDAAFFP